LSGDGRTVVQSRALVGKKGQELTARTVTTSETDGHGEVTSATTTWAEGARPEGDAGPEEVTETRTVKVDTGKHTRTDTVTTPAGTSTEVTDLATGRVIEATDAAGRTVKTEYDAAGRPVKQTAPDGLVTTTAYTPTSTTVTTPDGHVTVETTDLLGRPVKTTDNIRDGKFVKDDPAARLLQSTEYSGDGLTATVTDGAGRTTVTTNDALGRPVKTVAPNGMTQLTSYNDAATTSTSTKTTATLPAGESDLAKAVVTSTETSDSAGRPVASASSFADKSPTTPTSQSFDGLGRIKQSLSGEVAVTPSYDGPGGTPQQTTLTPANPGTFPGAKVTAGTKNDLTGAPVVKTLTPGTGGGTGTESLSGITVVRDDAGRVSQERRQDGKKTTFTYTPGGQVKETVSPGGITTSYRYEEKTGRVLEVATTSAGGKTTEKTGYTYEPETGRVTEVYDPDDKAGTLISYSYDAGGNTTQIAYPDGKTVRQTFSSHGQRTSLTDTAGLTTTYTYNPDGTLKEAVQHDKDGTETARIAYTYDGLGRITRAARGNGVITEVQFTGTSRIKHEKTSKDGTLITEAAYSYDAHGNLTQRTDTRPEARAGSTPGPAVKTTTRYTYDAYNRLLSSQILDTDSRRELTSSRYELNVAGDVVKTETTTRTGGKASTTVTEHGIDTTGRLNTLTTDGTEHPQTFNTDGSLLTSHQGTAYTYNTRNQPLSATTPDGTVTRYTYWADGTRATSTQTTPTSKHGDGDGTGTGQERVTGFYYAPDGTLINDTHTTPAPGSQDLPAQTTASYLMAGTRHARSLTGNGAEQAAATGTGYLIQDRHGNTTTLTNGQGAVSQAWNYTDYGQAADHTGTPLPHNPAAPSGPGRNPFTYAGEYTNPETGTQYLRARTYNPADGRFTTPDPAPQFNRYQAFGTNPVTSIDPEGTT
ncbi:RHS repeat-associated core domain-containing protein, partial [Streptomyces sp. NPDC001774]